MCSCAAAAVSTRDAEFFFVSCTLLMIVLPNIALTLLQGMGRWGTHAGLHMFRFRLAYIHQQNIYGLP